MSHSVAGVEGRWAGILFTWSGESGMVSLTTRLSGYGCFESCNGNQRHKCSSVPLHMQTTWACTLYVNLISATHCELLSLMCFSKPLIHCYTKCTSLMVSLCFCINNRLLAVCENQNIVLFFFCSLWPVQHNNIGSTNCVSLGWSYLFVWPMEDRS